MTTLLINMILGITLIAMLLYAMAYTFGWLGLLVYFCIGALLWMNRISAERRHRREHALMSGQWWRDLA